MVDYLLAADRSGALWIFLSSVVGANIVYEAGCFWGLAIVNPNLLIAQPFNNLRGAVGNVCDCQCVNTVTAVSHASINGNAADFERSAMFMDDLIDRS